MIGNEALDFGYDVLFHSQTNKRETARTSSSNVGGIPILKERAFSRTFSPMKKLYEDSAPAFDLPKLLKAVVENTGPGKRFTRRGLSLAATGGKNPDLVRDLISRGTSRKPSFGAVAGLATALGKDVSEFTKQAQSAAVEVYIRVVGAVEAGVWREQYEWPEEQQYEVRALQSNYPTLDRFGLVAVGYSMDKLFQPGVVLDCLKIPFSGYSPIRPTPGQIVIAQYNKGGLCETTCKRLGRDPDGQWYLQPESTKPEHQERIPIGAAHDDYALDDGIVIVGIVNAAIQQFLK